MHFSFSLGIQLCVNIITLGFYAKHLGVKISDPLQRRQALRLGTPGRA
jgi:hypothetical protein